jgi:hypothetical protein
LYKDYYTGENYANCLEQKSIIEKDEKYKIYYQIEGQETRKKIIDIILPTLEGNDVDDLKWKYATLSNCYINIRDRPKANEYEVKFLASNPLKWEINTFRISRLEIEDRLKL